MINRKKALVSLLMAAATFGGDAPIHEKKYSSEGKPTRQKLKRKASELKRDKYGLKCFIYGGVEVWARNKKNADRKAKNKNLI